MTRLRHVSALAALVAAEAGAVVLLHRLGDVPGLAAGTVLDARAPAGDAAMAAARLAGLAAAWWLLATTVLSMAVGVLGRASRIADRLTPAMIQGLVRRAIAAALSVSVVTGTAAPAVAGGAPPEPAGAGRPASLVVHEGVVFPPALLPPEALSPVVAARDAAGVAAAGEQPGAGPADPDAGAAPDVHVVAPGEHLWGVAEAALARAAGASPAALDAAAVAEYWRRLVDANRDRLRSGDPDLVHPGERLTLPPAGGHGPG